MVNRMAHVIGKMTKAALAGALILGVSGPLLARGPQRAAPPRPPTYEDFIALDIEQRRTLFAALDAAARTLLVRTHAERWLERNARQLASRQTAAVQKFIDFLPELFEQTTDRQAIQTERELSRAVRCQVGDAAFHEAFAVLHPPPARSRAWRDVVNDWLEWILTCVG
jgi:hypothetical protein